MTTWTSDQASRIGAAEELDLASLRGDGRLSSRRTMWVVPVDDRLFVRSVNGSGADWFRGTRAQHRGRVWAGGVEADVDLVDRGAADEPELNDRADAAYREKYGRYAAHILARITSAEARATTLELVAP